MDRLQAMKIFERVVEEGGFAAARAMDMSPPWSPAWWPSWSSTWHTPAAAHHPQAGADRRGRVVPAAGARHPARDRRSRGRCRCQHARSARHHPHRGGAGAGHQLSGPMVAVWHAHYPKLMLDISMDAYAASRVDEFDVTIMVAGEDFDANIVARPGAGRGDCGGVS